VRAIPRDELNQTLPGRKMDEIIKTRLSGIQFVLSVYLIQWQSVRMIQSLKNMMNTEREHFVEDECFSQAERK
jgi:hypothetical protein